jgi:hypothetical protein
VIEIPRVHRPAVVHTCIDTPGTLRTLVVLGISGISKVPVILDIPVIAQPNILSISAVFERLHVGSEVLLKLVEVGRVCFGGFRKSRRWGLVPTPCVHL